MLYPPSLRCFLSVALIFGIVGLTTVVAEEPAAITPMDAPLTEGGETLITVELKEDSPGPYSFKAGKGIYHYKLFLPQGYSSQPERRYPVIFFMSPGGNAGLQIGADRANKEGWIGVMLVEAKNGDWEPILGDMKAAHADVIQRVRIREGLKFATGGSGGSRGTSLLTQMCPGFAGVFLQGAGFAFQDNQGYQTKSLKSINPYSVFMAMGDSDSNANEVADLKKALPDNVAYKPVRFVGGHVAPPPELFDAGLDWLLVQTLMKADFPAQAPGLFNSITARAIALQDSPEKLERLEALSLLGRKLGFDRDPAQSAKLQEVDASLQKLKDNPEMAKITAAAAALKEADAKEEEELKDFDPNSTTNANDKKKAKIYKKLAELYQKVVQDYPGTPAGDEAAKKVEKYRGKS